MGARSLDKDRVRAYIEERGGRVVSINWSPFGKGWFGEKNDRIYEVVYYDVAGCQHLATCKTSLFSGVYWTEDRVAHGAARWYENVARDVEPGASLIGKLPVQAPNDEAGELRRLRAENERLRKALRKHGVDEEPDLVDNCVACGAAIAADARKCPACGIVLN
jgi:hypothetical protein